MSQRFGATAALLLMFVLTLAAGVVVGRLTSARPATHPPVAGGSPLADELQLTPEQSAQMRPIWEAAREAARNNARDAQDVQRHHEEQLAALLTPEQRQQYGRLSDENHKKIADLDAKRREAFAKAVARTREILRPDQWTAYEQILKNQVGSVPTVDDVRTTAPSGG
jgi:Spy/CpxP family protein refolding chaperone